MHYYQDPDFDELRIKLKAALAEELEEKAQRRMEKRMSGVSDTLNTLKNQDQTKERITLDESGAVINGVVKRDTQPTFLNPLPVVIRTNGPDEIAGAVVHPSKPSDIRRLIRSKMVRCKKCKNRFLEKHLYERHLRDRHPVDYMAHLIQQEEDMQKQRKEELEANRLEEIVSGGFIPPAEDLDSKNFDVIIETIPLPGELTNGVPARFDKYESAEFVQCLKCFKAVSSKEDLDAHPCEMVYVCFECTPIRNLCTEVRLYNHRAKFHRGANSGFKCNLCNLKFLTPRKLRKHKKMSHVFTKTYACHFCEELFTSETSVTTHERIHTGIIKFECKVCDFKCNRFLAMEDHKKDEHGYLCSVCQEKLSEYSDIKNHTLNEHGGYLSSEFKAGYIESPRVWVMFKGE